jgi:hypothetical protein
MSLQDILGDTEGGGFFRNAARAAGVSEADAKSAIGKLAPAIALALKDKAAADPEAFEDLLELLEDNGDADLNAAGALTDDEARSDGAAILQDLHGSAAAAQMAAGKRVSGISAEALATLNAISATGVLAALSQQNVATLSDGAVTAADTQNSGGGFLSILFAALLKGLLQGASRQLAPKRRRRRSYAGYYGRRAAPRRRRRRTPGLDDIFKDILGGSRR